MYFKPFYNPSEADIKRFWSLVDIGEAGSCWEWKAGKFSDGYGRFQLPNFTAHANRLAYFLHYGVDPMALCVCHKCDVRSCCNPHHMFLGTKADNCRDMDAKGRRVTCPGDANGARKHRDKMRRGDQHGLRLHPERIARGERQGNAKLTAVSIEQIRKRVANGETHTSVAKAYGISRPHINRIMSRKVWKHVA